jgi:hypothetical protein
MATLTPTPDTTITTGDRVRSFDFDSRDLTGDRACYIEGVVTHMRELNACQHYAIRCDRRVFAGKETSHGVGETMLPPANGTPTWLGNVTNYVERI